MTPLPADSSLSSVPVDVVILAGGKGSRLKSQCPKVLQPLLGKALIQRVLDSLLTLPVETVYVIVGYQADRVVAFLEAVSGHYPFAIKPILQPEQRGTGDAVKQLVLAECAIERPLLILSGDVPLITSQSLQQLIAAHHQQQAQLTVVGAIPPTPYGYGRLVLDEQKRPIAIVEEKDATEEQKALNLVNAGIYVADWTALSPLLGQLSANSNAQGELYLTDCIALANQAGHAVALYELTDWQEMQGINTRQDLAEASRVLNRRSLERLMQDGVTIISPENTWIAPEVQIGADSTVYPGCWLMGAVEIGAGCEIGPHAVIKGPVTIGDACQVMASFVSQTQMGERNSIGPYAQLRDGVTLTNDIKIGNFVEMKNARLDHHSFVSHLAYVGDADCGWDVNIGAGAITANYNPISKEKHRTRLGDHVSLGSNSVVIAPIEIGKYGSVAAGSVINKPVAPYELAIARCRQTGIKGWVQAQLDKLQTSLAK